MKKDIQAKHVSDDHFLGVVDLHRATTGHWAMWRDVEPAFPGIPFRVLLAKASKLIKRGYMTGCACGCYGGLEVTEDGRNYARWLSGWHAKVQGTIRP